MPRTLFFGRESLGEDEESPAIPADSPRLAGNRQTAEEMRADHLLAKLGDRLVTDGRHRFVVRAGTPLKAHHIALGPAPERAPTHELWRLPDGSVARHSTAAHKALSRKAGWAYLGRIFGPSSNPESVSANLREQADLDTPHVLDDGSTYTKRQAIEAELEREARDANAPRRRIGRQWVDGEGAVPKYDGDESTVAVPSDKRTTMTDLADSVNSVKKKP